MLNIISQNGRQIYVKGGPQEMVIKFISKRIPERCKICICETRVTKPA